MMWIIEDTMPHIHLTASGTHNNYNIMDAYKDFTKTRKGISGYLSILDGIVDGVYNELEVLIAGVFVTDGLDGYMIVGQNRARAKYIRLNDEDFVMFSDGTVLFFPEQLGSWCKFEGDNGVLYEFDNTNIKSNIEKDSQLCKADHLKGSKKSQNKNN